MEGPGTFEGEIRHVTVDGKAEWYLWDDTEKAWREIDQTTLNLNYAAPPDEYNYNQMNEIDDIEESEEDAMPQIKYSGDAYFKRGVYDSAVILNGKVVPYNIDDDYSNVAIKHYERLHQPKVRRDQIRDLKKIIKADIEMNKAIRYIKSQEKFPKENTKTIDQLFSSVSILLFSIF